MHTLETLRRFPAFYPLRIDEPGNVTLVQLDEAAYSAASFLDERLMSAGHPLSTCPLRDLVQAADPLAPRAHYIFHIGHVGSTLLSRLLGTHATLFSVREPLLLRALAQSPHHELAAGGTRMTLETVLGLLGRTWRRQQRALIKPTSMANGLAGRILAGADQPRAVLLYVTPLNYLRGILGGPNSRREAQALAPPRLRRLLALAPALETQAQLLRFEGEWIAMNWLCEMATLQAAAISCASRTLWVDFDVFLSAPAAGLRQIFRALGVDPLGADIDALLAGPLMRQYSKAPEHAYDAALRNEVLQAAEYEHGAEIRRGMAWLNGLAGRHAWVGGLLR